MVASRPKDEVDVACAVLPGAAPEETFNNMLPISVCHEVHDQWLKRGDQVADKRGAFSLNPQQTEKAAILCSLVLTLALMV